MVGAHKLSFAAPPTDACFLEIWHSFKGEWIGFTTVADLLARSIVTAKTYSTKHILSYLLCQVYKTVLPVKWSLPCSWWRDFTVCSSAHLLVAAGIFSWLGHELPGIWTHTHYIRLYKHSFSQICFRLVQQSDKATEIRSMRKAELQPALLSADTVESEEKRKSDTQRWYAWTLFHPPPLHWHHIYVEMKRHSESYWHRQSLLYYESAVICLLFWWCVCLLNWSKTLKQTLNSVPFITEPASPSFPLLLRL